MNHHLVRTRSQHFVSSPRKIASPLISRHALCNGRHAPKRRKITQSAFVLDHSVTESENESDSEPEYDMVNGTSSPVPAEGSRRTGKQIHPLSAQGGQQIVNKATLGHKSTPTRRRSNNIKRDDRKSIPEPVHKPKGKEKASDVFLDEEDNSSSPRKRKRSNRASDSEGDSGSWIEMDEDEQEPEFIAENDQHLIDSAPAHALHRLRKAELVRLWKVAGMWPTDDSVSSETAEDEDGGMGKKDLVDGIIAARNRAADRLISPLPSSPTRGSPRRKVVVEITRSASSSQRLSPMSSASSRGSESEQRDSRERDKADIDITPHAPPRTRSKVRMADNTVVRTVPRRTNGNRDRRKSAGQRHVFRGRSKSMGVDKEDKKARFGDEVKSPGKGLINRARRSSTISSAYTTTDTSPPEKPALPKKTPRAARKQNGRRLTPARRQTPGKKGRAVKRDIHPDPDEEDVEEQEEVIDSDDDEVDHIGTPLVQRLRPRGTRDKFEKELSSEVDADDEENEDGQDEGSDGEVTEQGDTEEVQAPLSGPSRRLRNRDKRMDSDVSMESSHKSRSLPSRGAKRKALEAIKGVDDDTDEMDVDVDMGEIDLEGDADDTADDGGDHFSSSRLTRSQATHSKDVTPPRRRPTRRSSQRSPSIEKDEEQDDHDDDEAEEEEQDETEREDNADGVDLSPGEETDRAHTTRSGKAFGVMQSRRNRLRQEAMDDPDMDVDEDEEEESETDDDSFEVDIDLSEATVASLTRLLRDELVQMCEVRGIEVGGTKPQLAKALIEWRDEQKAGEGSNPSSQATARPGSSLKSKSTSRSRSSRKVIHAIASDIPHPGKPTPVLLRDHFHATDPATPPHSDDSKPINSEAELNLDLSELGLEDSMIKPQQLVKLEKIGSGGFKDVFVGKLRGRKVAISEFRGHLSEMDIRELKLLAEFSHPNIVKFRGICIPEDSTHVPCMLVSELCENGDLFDYIRNVDCPSLKRVLYLMLDIARGLEYLHTRNPSIIHRDCKSSNILINRQGQAKVGDFGLARVKNSTRSMIRSLVGTVNWQAPELWHPHPRYDYKVDVFSAGMVFWEMMSGWIGDKKYPWEGHNEHYIYDAVGAKQKRPSISGLRKHWGDEPVNLMERMWHQDPAERPTMTDVVTDLESLVAEFK